MEDKFEAEGVRGVLHQPEHPNGDAIALTHGAGSNCNAPLLVKLAGAFTELGYLVLRYDLPFRQRGGTPHPSGAGRDREGIAQAIAELAKLATGRVFAAGLSYGGRQSAMAAAERPQMAAALLLLSYPLHPPGKPDQKRTAYFPELRTPALFVHGTKDPFGSEEEIRDAITLIPVRTDILIVDRAGHDLKRAGEMAGEIAARLRRLL
jgi:predicted alpha/beta-hydrolase family hydrolase